nr:DUF4296 domain-containing protein [Hymenobacter piscis]
MPGLSACQKSEEVPVPPRLIASEKMVRLLVELHTLEARADGAGLPLDSARALFRQEQKKLYRQFNVTDSVFTRSYRYYAIHGKDLDAIYSAVVDSLARRETRRRPADAPPAHQ